MSPTNEGKNGKSCQMRNLCFQLKKPKLNKNSTAHAVENLFYKQGLLVARHPNWFIVVPLLITSTLSCGIFTIKWDHDMQLVLTPSNAYSLHEVATFTEFINDPGGLFHFTMVMFSKDGGSLLRDEYRTDVVSLHDYFQNNHTVTVEGVSYTFSQLQINHADENKLLLSILETYNKSGLPFQLTYPVITYNSDRYYVGSLFVNVSVDPNSKFLNFANGLGFHFNSAKGNAKHYHTLKQWARSVLYHPLNVFPRLEYIIWNEDLFGLEMNRQSSMVFPYVVLSFTVLITFAFIVSSSRNPVKCKPLEALSSVIAVLTACGTGFGIIFMTGIPFVGIVTIVPVLVLALGMDVTYIILRAWRTTSAALDPGIRLAESLKESGPSIVITASTNILSAAVGCATSSYMVYMFCLCLTISVATLFVMQITFFPAFIYYGGLREQANRHGFIPCIKFKVPNSDIKNDQPSSASYSDWWCKWSKTMAKVITSNYCRITVSALMIIYWALSVYFCDKMQLGLTPEKCIPPDSGLLKILNMEQNHPKHGRLLYVIVSNPPKFTDLNDYDKFENMVKEFEAMPDCVGANATALWVHSFENFRQYFLDDGNTSDFYQNLQMYLQTSDGERWNHYLKLAITSDNSTLVKQFMFTVAYKATYDWDIRTNYTDTWRSIAEKYPQFNVTSWFDDNFNFVVDQLQALPSNTVQDFIITLVCMAVICILFVPNVFNTICALLTIVSIVLGTFGFLMAWSVALDPISMSTMLLSIGYSVDFTSHITYHYYSSAGKTPEEKLSSALGSIGLPMLESGISTVLCVACLCFVPIYMVIVFFKNIFLVVVIGLLHGLIILPMFVAWIPLDCFSKLYNKKCQPSSIHVVTVNA